MCDKGEEFDVTMIPELLPLYYKRLFPFGPFYRWLSYGNLDTRHFCNREFSFTLHDDIYIRYQSFNNQQELEEAIKKKTPYKIDIGAVYSFAPSSHRQMTTALIPLERELVFDIDLTDYDDVRTCCEGSNVCQKCWQFMAVACKIIDFALREDFGWSHILWVFSGRRGIHCWVSDQSARVLSNSERAVVGEYLQLIQGGQEKVKKVYLPNTDRLHSSVRRAVEIIEEQFSQLCIDNQGLFEKDRLLDKFLALIPEETLKKKILSIIEQGGSSKDAWLAIKSVLTDKSSAEFRKHRHLYDEILLQFAYPRLDINVTKGLNHLLKSPFCVHPKTGKICVPFNPKTADKFNIAAVPTLQSLIDEINSYDRELQKQSDSENFRSRVKDYKKTSMNRYLMIFEEFVRYLEESWKGKQIKIGKSDESMEF